MSVAKSDGGGGEIVLRFELEKRSALVHSRYERDQDAKVAEQTLTQH